MKAFQLMRQVRLISFYQTHKRAQLKRACPLLNPSILQSLHQILFKAINCLNKITQAGGGTLTEREIKEFRGKLNHVVAEFNSELAKRYGTKFEPIKTMAGGDVVELSASKLDLQLRQYLPHGNVWKGVAQEYLYKALSSIITADKWLDLAARGFSRDSILTTDMIDPVDPSETPRTYKVPILSDWSLQKAVVERINSAAADIQVARQRP